MINENTTFVQEIKVEIMFNRDFTNEKIIISCYNEEKSE